MPEANRIELRRAAAEDDVFLRVLYGATRQAEIPFLPGPPEAKERFLEMQFQAQQRHYQSKYPDAEHSIVLSEGASAGRSLVDRQASEILIVDLSLMPDFQRRGIGRSLVSNLQKEAAASGKALTGSVGRWNPAAGFWRQMGFNLTDRDQMYWRISWRLSAGDPAAQT